MSEERRAKSIDETLKQSLLEFKDQMSVYTTHAWSENGHGYDEADGLGLQRDSPVRPPSVRGRGPCSVTRQINTIEQRVGLEREMEVHSHGPVHSHFEGGSRYTLYY